MEPVEENLPVEAVSNSEPSLAEPDVPTMSETPVQVAANSEPPAAKANVPSEPLEDNLPVGAAPNLEVRTMTEAPVETAASEADTAAPLIEDARLEPPVIEPSLVPCTPSTTLELLQAPVPAPPAPVAAAKAQVIDLAPDPQGGAFTPRMAQTAPPQLPLGMPPYPPPPPPSKPSFPTWLATVVATTALFLGAAWIVQRPAVPAHASANLSPRPVVAPPSPAEPARQPEFPPHPFAKFVEVAGLRVVVDLNHRSQVQYLVVNHSALDLTDLALHIVVRSAFAPPDSSPLFSVSARVPNLGPHESKEIRTDLGVELRSSQIPDWDGLRSEVTVSLPQ
jgi:hypothetical protein